MPENPVNHNHLSEGKAAVGEAERILGKSLKTRLLKKIEPLTLPIARFDSSLRSRRRPYTYFRNTVFGASLIMAAYFGNDFVQNQTHREQISHDLYVQCVPDQAKVATALSNLGYDPTLRSQQFVIDIIPVYDPAHRKYLIENRPAITPSLPIIDKAHDCSKDASRQANEMTGSRRNTDLILAASGAAIAALGTKALYKNYFARYFAR